MSGHYVGGSVTGGSGGVGDVVGPGSSTNNDVVFFNGTTGKLIKDSGLTLSGTNTGDQTITLTGDVTGSGTGSFAATISNSAVTLAKIANASASSKLLGSGASGSGAPYAELTLGTNLSLSGTTLNATGSGTVTTTGSPATGNLTKFSGGTSVTNGDLAGDVTTSGTLAATIATAAVTYAKIQNVTGESFLGRVSSSSGAVSEVTLSASQLAGRGSTGDLAPISLGAGLTMTGTTISSTASGGGLVLLEQHTASSSATLDFTTFISSTYDDYIFKFVGVQAATSTANFTMRMGTGGGPTYDTGSNYEWAGWSTNQATATAATGSNSIDTSIQLGASLATTSTKALIGNLELFDPQNATIHKFVAFQTNYGESTGNTSHRTGGGTYLSTTAVTAIRFLFSSGNIAAGTIRVYGVAKT